MRSMLGLPFDSINSMVARCLRNECGLLATNQSKEEKGGEHEDRLEKAQEDACVYNEEKDAELP